MSETWTTLSLVRWTADHFRRRGLASPRLDAELLLAHARGCRRLDLYLDFEKPVDGEVRARFRELVVRRADERVPVAYLTGEREFWSLAFEVTPDVLVPRPETETLVRVAVQLAPDRIAELGTGSGCISVALARELPSARIVALDRSQAALDVARRNLERHGLAQRVELCLADGLAGLCERVDAVVSNPPYVPTAELAGLSDEVRHEPRLALDGGPDGLSVVREWVAQAPERLARPGWLLLEVGRGQARTVEELLRERGAGRVDIHKDLAGTERVVAGLFEGGG